jgi:hypothetical protein
MHPGFEHCHSRAYLNLCTIIAMALVASSSGNLAGSYHFHIASPKYDDCFDDQLVISIKKLSAKTLCIDDHRLDTAEGSSVVLVSLLSFLFYHRQLIGSSHAGTIEIITPWTALVSHA